MIKLFRLFFSKTLILVYSVTWILTILLGFINVYNVKQQSADFSAAFLSFSIMIFFLLFFVLESNRIYQFFRDTDYRLLPISTRKLYFCNVIFSTIVGFSFFIGNAIIGVLINYTIINIPLDISISWIDGVAAIVDVVVLFLVVQFLVCIYSASKQFIQKRFRWISEIALFVLFMILMDRFSGFDLGIIKGFVIDTFGMKQEIYFRVILQVVTACLYFNLSIWVINRFVEAGDK
ncbi:hypothetical protein [Candidatus Enterococcus ikei]|uniref:ABC transporter permease n=1 Tax=Candidatus Enterococcus ikei TaxID=2815326 RepID=A0ABS3GY32_9ENTE|nr:hypothetical protein [Enterococcus sp. DIV0869a]MBO0440178.1 hypothetical protein [Enterococcus sp. DIV0869a]